MKKITPCLIALLCLIAFASCGKKDKKALLESVPAETAGLYILDANSLCQALDLELQDDEVSYGKFIKQAIAAADLNKKETQAVKEALKCVCLTEKTILAFEYDKEIFVTFFVNDQEQFIKTLEDVEGSKLSFSDENGYLVSDMIAVKDSQAWICINTDDPDDSEIDTKTIDKLRDLDSEKQFITQYEKIADSFLAEGVIGGVFIDINTVKTYLDSYTQQAFGLAQSIAFDDAAYLVATTTLSDAAVTTEMRILNSKQDPAKFNLPLATITQEGLSHINANAPFIAALAIDPATFDKIAELVNKYGYLSPSDRMAFDTFKTINGTIALSFGMSTPEEPEITLSASCKDAASAKSAGELVYSLLGGGDGINLSYAGNYLIARLQNSVVTKGGKLPAALIGQYAGLYIDYSKIDKNFIEGIDCSKLGSACLTLGPDGKGIKLKFTWEVSNPIKTALDFALDAVNNAGNINTHFGFAGQRTAYEVDSMAYDPYSSYYEPVYDSAVAVEATEWESAAPVADTAW